MIACLFVAALSYLDFVEIAVKAYDDSRMEEYVREAETTGVQEHGFPRLASNLGRLVAAGRMTEKKPMLERMLTVACACAKKGKMPPKSGGNEFSVRELVSAVVALEKAGSFPPERIAAWKADLAAVDAQKCYSSSELFKLGDAVGHNWPLFGAASEQARIHYGLGGDPKFVEVWVADQLRHFDRNGMYRDPHEPTVYDFIGRLCYMQILHFGYDGPCRAKVEEELMAAAEPTLAMLSVSGEIPFGGRSNQFLHNNTMYAAVAEWYAAFFARRGDAAMAARFRSAAARAVAALEPWVRDGRVFHVKNRFHRPETKGVRNVSQSWFGCECYAYFDKYMVTMGTWAVLADGFSRGQPLSESGDAPTLDFSTSEHFHWRFVQSRNYTVQEDRNANAQYDATGIGRIHRRGAPSAICLSTPFAEKPNYSIGIERNPGPLAIAATDGKMSYEVGDWGVTIKVTGGGTLTLPAFEFDGEETTRIAFDAKLVRVSYRGWTCRYATRGGTFADTGLRYFNRNGRYRRIDCTGKDFEVFVTIEKEDHGTCIRGETELRARIPDIFAKSAAHYRALDAAATPLMKDAKGSLRTPHGFNRATRELNMRTIYGWTSGHFPGALWYLYEATGDGFFKDRATAWMEILEPNKANDTNHDVGFIIYCSFGNARRILKTDSYDGILAETAASLSKRYNEALGLVRSWGRKDETKEFLVIPDNMMNLELLEAVSQFSGDPRFDRIARSHATVTMKHHFRTDGGTYHVLNYDQRPDFLGAVQEIRRGQGLGCETAWSRGQSWAIYGYTMMYRFTKDPAYLAFAQKVSDFAINHPNMPADGVPYWDYGAPGEERDSSAASVMASGLLELADFVGGEKGAGYRAFAVKQLLSLASPDYFSEGDEIGHFLLKHGVGHKPGGSEIDAPLDYGDYYFLEALVRFVKAKGLLPQGALMD